MANGQRVVSPLVQKTAYIGAIAVGTFVAVKLMVDFGGVLKPLVLAAMFVACVEWYVDLLEEGIKLYCCFCCGRSGQVSRSEQKCSSGDACAKADLEEPLMAPERTGYPGYLEALGRKCVEVLQGIFTGLARPLAALMILSVMGSILFFLGAALVEAVAKTDLTVYQTGFQQAKNSTVGLFSGGLSPWLQKQVDQHTQSAMEKLGNLVGSALNTVLDVGSGFFSCLVMFLIYVLMWLLVPMHGDKHKHLFKIVQTFFALKAACNLCFAVLTFGLLKLVQVDLAIVLALSSFVLGFIPEVGAIMAIALPMPLILLDSRIPNVLDRLVRFGWVAGGLMLIKFLVSNGLESIVMGRNKILAGISKEGQKFEETHPVIVLFAVVLLGEIWGVTGMLVSVPMISMIRLVINEWSREGLVEEAA